MDMQEYNTIAELLNAKEGNAYQFKEWKTKDNFGETKKICCALADGGGGKFVMGISDKRPRQVVGSTAFPQPERTRKDLIDTLHISIDFQLYDYEGKRVLVFDVASRPIGLPVQVEGVAWWYEGDSLIAMPPEIMHGIYEETGRDFSGDICPGATFKNLNSDAIEAFRAKWIEKSGNKRLKNLTAEQLLRDCGAISDKGITHSALVLFGSKAGLQEYLSQAEVIFEYRSSEASGAAQQREEFLEGFFSIYDKLWELVNLRNDKQHYQEGFFVFDIPTFNERVVREAILNAVSHRNYQLGGSIFIRQYRDRLEIESPGGFPLGITKDNILNRQYARNRTIAKIFALCGLVERAGQGMNLIYEMSIKEAKRLPDFGDSDEYLVKIKLNGLVLDKRMILVIKKIGDERLDAMTTDDFLLINALYHERPLPVSLRSRVKHLVGMGLVEHVSRNKYVLSRSLYEATDKTGVHTRVVGLDRDTNKELLLKHIRKNENNGTPFKELEQVLPSHSRNQIKVLLRELQQADRIYVVGKTSAARWYAR
jgi:ATP-dependent DNA helicase RecG